MGDRQSDLGELTVPDDLPELVTSSGLAWPAVDHRHVGGVRAVAGLPHRDPFDRLLVAQAAVEGLVLVTADDVLLGAELDGVAVRDARA